MVKFYLSQSSQFSFPVFLKRLLIVTLLLFFMKPAIAQQPKKNYNLLWRISGKGLTKPSYLFGTMHVKDKRAFAFSDSVMLAIKSSSAFALEVQPDSLVKAMFNQLDSRDSLRSLRKWLSAKEYAKLAKRFKQKKGYDMGDMDPMSLESAMRPDKENPGDKASVVDAYLYGVALTMGKDIYGLENTAEQFDSYFGVRSNIKERVKELVNNDDAADSKSLSYEEQLLKLYNTGNLDAIRTMINDEQLNDDELVARNKVMFNSIAGRIHNQTLFSAVGCAHLPGDHGLIALLRNAGYTVTAVKADFTGVADKFNTDLTKLSWKTYTYQNDGYTVKLPFEPIKTNAFYGMPTVFFADIANEVFMGVYATQIGSGLKPADSKKVLDRMLASFKKSPRDKVLSQKNIVVDGENALEVIMKTTEVTMRLRVLVANNFLYVVYAGHQLATLNSPYVNKFFNSFKPFKTAQKASPDWITFKHDSAAFSVHLPGEPKHLVKDVAFFRDTLIEPAHIHVYMAVDTVNFENYLVRYNDYPKGAYIADKNALFNGLNNMLGSKITVVKQPRKIEKDGYEGREEDVLLFDKYYCRLQVFVRGNRTYLLLRQNPQEGAKEDDTKDDFFESFKFLPYDKPVIHQDTVDGGNFTVAAFQKPNPIIDTASYQSFAGNSITTYTTNVASGGVYGVEHNSLSRYYRVHSVDSIYNYFTHTNLKYTDTLLKDEAITVNGIKGHEFITQVIKTGQKKRNRIFVDNGDLFYLTCHLAEEELFSETSDAFFNSLKKIRPTDTIDLYSSKAKKITEGLLSTDTTTFKYANGALSYYDFEKAELPYIYQALEKPYANDSTYEGTAHKLVRILRATHDDKTIDVLSAVYKNPQIHANVKPVILSAIVDIDKQKGYDTYFDLLTNVRVKKARYSFSAFTPLSDSLDLVVTNYDRIIPLLKDENSRSGLLNIFESMTTAKDGKYTDFIHKHFNDLTVFANADLDRFLNKKDSMSREMYMPVYYYLSLMQKVKGQPITAGFTAKLVKQGDMDKLFPEAVTARIKNHLPVTDLAINRLLDSIDQRYDLMQTLSKEKQLVRVPAKYKTQAAFAKISLYQSLVANDEEEGTPQHIKLLGTIADKGKLFYVFSYKGYYDEEEDSSSQLGICGPYTPGSAKLDFSSYHVYSEQAKKGTGWQKQAKKMIPELKKQNEEELAVATE